MIDAQNLALQRLTVTVTTLMSAVEVLMATHPNAAEALLAFADKARVDYANDLERGYEEEVIEFAQSLRLKLLSTVPK